MAGSPGGDALSRFSGFICSLRSGAQPSQQSFDAFLARLRPALLRQILWRGLWDRPPGYLGVVGGSWADPTAQEELLADFCEFMVRRLPGLWKRCEEESGVDYLVYLNIRHFVHQAQERHDPVGSRIYRILKAAVKRGLEGGTMVLLAGGSESPSSPRLAQKTDGGSDRHLGACGRLRYGSTLGFAPGSDPGSTEGVDLAERIEAWRGELLPDLVTAYQLTGVVVRVEACIGRLRDLGVESFLFGDLMDGLRTQARHWLAAARQSSQRPSAPEDAGEENPTLVPVVSPDTGIEGRDVLYKLRRCVVAGVEQLENRRTRGYLLKLWLCLHGWATESSSRRAGEAAGEGTRVPAFEGDKPPSAKKLGELLGIPRNRMPGLYRTLGQLVRGCQRAVSGNVPVNTDEGADSPGSVPPAGGRSHARQDGAIDMSQKSRLERLRLEFGEAAARFAGDRARTLSQKRWPPRLGDVFLLEETAGAAPVEWVAVEQDAENLGLLLVVPADDNPFVGSRDVEVPAGAGGGLTSIRCDLGVWLDGRTLDPERRTGVLNLEIVQRVRRKRAEVLGGKRPGSLLEQEVDEDPDYQEWRQTLAEAHGFLQARSAPEARAVPASRWPTFGSPAAIAASILLLVALGLGGTAVRQRARLAELAQELPAAMLNLPFHHFTGMEPVRGSDRPLVVPAGARRIALIFEVAEPEPYPSYRLEILEKDTGREVWKGDGLSRIGSEISLDLPRALFSSGSYRFRIHGVGETAPELLVEYALTLELE